MLVDGPDEGREEPWAVKFLFWLEPVSIFFLSEELALSLWLPQPLETFDKPFGFFYTLTAMWVDDSRITPKSFSPGCQNLPCYSLSKLQLHTPSYEYVCPSRTKLK